LWIFFLGFLVLFERAFYSEFFRPFVFRAF
jgi:hypothetical protein